MIGGIPGEPSGWVFTDLFHSLEQDSRATLSLDSGVSSSRDPPSPERKIDADEKEKKN